MCSLFEPTPLIHFHLHGTPAAVRLLGLVLRHAPGQTLTDDDPQLAFPEEDKLEYDVHEAHRRHDALLSQLNVESQAAELLARAAQHMDSCYSYVKKALEFSSLGLLSFIPLHQAGANLPLPHVDMWSHGPG